MGRRSGEIAFARPGDGWLPTARTRGCPPATRVLLLLAGPLLGGIAAAQLGAGTAARGAPTGAIDLPPAAIAELLDAAPLPPISVDPRRRYLVLVHQQELLPLQNLAEPTLSVGGLRINPRTLGPHAPLGYFGLTLVDTLSGQRTPIPLPRDVTLSFPRWAADGSRFAFTMTVKSGIELWIGEPSEGRARRLIGPNLNAAMGSPCGWMPDNRHMLCRLIAGERSSAPQIADRPPEIAGPLLAQLGGLTPFGAETLDAELTQSLLESQLVMIDVLSGQRREIGGPAAIEFVDPAPSGAFLLVSRWLRPYPDSYGLGERGRVTEIWDRMGRIVRSIPAAGGPRAWQWHASAPATLIWVEAAEGGDRIMAQPAPFSAPAAEIFRTGHRFAGIEWLEGSNRILVSEYDPLRRVTQVWMADTGRPEELRRLVGLRSVDAPYPDLGTPMTKYNHWGRPVVAVHQGSMFLRGEEPTAQGTRTYLERRALDSATPQRLWQSGDGSYETVVDLLAPDGSVLLTQHETSLRPPNYFVRDLRLSADERITDFTHPSPELARARRIPLRYAREDGYELSSTLYVPADYQPSDSLPLIVWAYPRQYGNEAPSLAFTPAERFPGFSDAFKLFFLLRGYAVMDDVAMPVIGNSEDANDTFIDQIVANARAAIAAAAATGIADPHRVGVAGHSYGAFMVANLLAHSRLFQAGVAMSGAYNRTLTPFGFQTERRTLWEARDTYLELSPILYSNRIEAPLLLVHGLLDENAGTQPIQSTYFYEAIRRNGGQAELLLLPLEGHSYRGRESVLQTAAAMLNWFERHLKTGADAAPQTVGRADNAP